MSALDTYPIGRLVHLDAAECAPWCGAELLITVDGVRRRDHAAAVVYVDRLTRFRDRPALVVARI